MEEVLHYLDLKNRYYEKFHALTTRFLEDACADRWERLAETVDSRERILHILRSFDFKIARLFEEIDPTAYDLGAYAPRVRELFDRREELVKSIVTLDLELIGRIDEVKTEALREKKLKEAFRPFVEGSRKNVEPGSN